MARSVKVLGLLAAFMGFVAQGCGDDAGTSAHFADQQWESADMVRGGRLYDQWWAVNGRPPPVTSFDPLWASQSTNKRSGSATWRCKECHGWDYLGRSGQYSSGSHFTGFEGVWPARTKARGVVFDAVKGEGGDHDFSAVLSDTDVLDLTRFIVEGLVDMTLYVDAGGVATGDAALGQPFFAETCAACHGSDGRSIDFDEEADGSQGVGWLANDNPQETLHKIRWGHPGSGMPSMVANGLSDDQIGDLLAYAQTLPYAASRDRSAP